MVYHHVGASAIPIVFVLLVEEDDCCPFILKQIKLTRSADTVMDALQAFALAPLNQSVLTDADLLTKPLACTTQPTGPIVNKIHNIIACLNIDPDVHKLTPVLFFYANAPASTRQSHCPSAESLPASALSGALPYACEPYLP